MKNLFLIFIGLFILNFACKNKTIYSSGHISLKDDLNKEFVFSKVPERIISLAPNITESIYAIDADSLLAGVTTFCDYPPETALKTKIGGMLDPDLEKITSLNPDLILLTVEGNSKSTYQSLNNLGLNVFAFNPRNLNGICKMINDLGLITNKIENSRKVVENLNKDSDSLLALTKYHDVKTCFIIISIIPLMTANKTTFVNEIVNSAGLKNIYSDEINAYPEISFEDLILKKPDYFIFPVNLNNIIFINNSKDLLKEKLYLKDTFIENNLILIDENLFMRPGPRILKTSFEILKKIHSKKT